MVVVVVVVVNKISVYLSIIYLCWCRCCYAAAESVHVAAASCVGTALTLLLRRTGRVVST